MERVEVSPHGDSRLVLAVRLIMVGTSEAAVTRCFSASRSHFAASNLSMQITWLPSARATMAYVKGTV